MSTAELLIQVDRRERGRVVKRLEESEGVRLDMVDLEFGDYVLPNHIVVERKSATDFILSVVDEGLWTNIANLKPTYSRIVYIIEGDPYVARFHQKALDVHRAFARMTVDHGIAVLPSADADHTAMLIYLMGQAALEQASRA
ncbi:MAG: ERCC4 domain-containing protein [Acidiferrobacter sp.]